jgi:hypothetical protein
MAVYASSTRARRKTLHTCQPSRQSKCLADVAIAVRARNFSPCPQKTDTVLAQVKDLLTIGEGTTGTSVGCVLLTGDQLIGVEQLTMVDSTLRKTQRGQDLADFLRNGDCGGNARSGVPGITWVLKSTVIVGHEVSKEQLPDQNRKLPTDAALPQLNRLLVNGVAATDTVIGSILLAGGQLLGVKQLTQQAGGVLDVSGPKNVASQG